MLQHLETIKGIHPGFILDRELKRRKLKKNQFASQINEHPQTIVAITKGRRGMNTSLAIKAEKALGLEEGILMILQVYHEIAVIKNSTQQPKPDLTTLRKILFWDTSIDKIDWQKHKNAVINRVFDKGNQTEKDEIIRFYGKDSVELALQNNR
jgi:plasmid maintenance system antidote protein VapI